MSLFKKKENESCCCGGNCCEETINQTRNMIVLGGGCPKCNALEKSAKEALEELNMKDEINHITDFGQIAAMGVMSTPALVIDNTVVSMGRVLTKDEVVEMIKKVRG